MSKFSVLRCYKNESLVQHSQSLFKLVIAQAKHNFKLKKKIPEELFFQTTSAIIIIFFKYSSYQNNDWNFCNRCAKGHILPSGSLNFSSCSRHASLQLVLTRSLHKMLLVTSQFCLYLVHEVLLVNHLELPAPAMVSQKGNVLSSHRAHLHGTRCPFDSIEVV